MTFRVVRTNQYNQDLGLIHSTNGNHLESANEGSSIDHQLLHTANQSLNSISTHVSSLDQSYARLRYDTNITRHHTTKLCDMLKSTAEGFDIRIDVLERTLTQRMVDELAVVKSQLAVIVEDLKESGATKNGEGGSSSRPSGRGRGGSSSQGGRGKGRSDDSERFKYSKWL
ncbi:hypothetical protein F511_41207 [Dorcoceras hygrometricum]|uniref:Uncharacterized protein n=1 Tax=Dorcoceras hygrometricum TaxID=472368 RepID=A0A2Z7CAA2_9LAMI|nr:hypothetical protein F511_41207 [Dorcoceras hygrometricum]